MSSGKDYCSLDDSACDSLRRSNRITRYSIRKTKATIGKKAKAGKKLMRVKGNEKLSSGTQQKADDKSDERAAYAFSGEPLSPEELQQLLVKFKEDGDFCYKMTSASSSRPVASTTKDIRPATKRKKQRDVLTAAVASKRTNMDDNVENNRILRNALVPEAMTSSNPLPHATGSTLHISASKSQYVPVSRSEHHKSWNGPIICRNLLSSGSFREGNGIDFSWNRDSFPPVASSKPCPFGSTVNPCKPLFKDANPSVPWKSFERENGQLDNRNDANACGFYSNRDKPQTGSNDNSTRIQNSRSYRENTDYSYVNCTKLRTVQTPYNNVCANFNENGSAAGALLDKQMNPANSTFVTPTESPYGNSASIWNVAGPNVPNTFATDNSSMQHPTGPQNTMNYVSPDFCYNNENKSSNDLPHRSHGFGGGDNSGIGYNNCNAHYLMTWKSLQVFPNGYSNATDSYVNDASNCPISPVVPSMFVNESDNFVGQTNCWLQNNSSNRGSFPNAGNETGLSVVANNFANPAPPTSTTDESTMVTRMNPNDKAALFFDDFPDSQDRTFCSTVSSIGSYDDDIDYDNCLVIDENSVSTPTTPSHESFLDPLATMKAEDRPMYESTANFSQYNNYRFNNQESMLYNFDTKAELASSPDCVIIPNSTRT